MLGRYEEALASFDRALALTPDQADTWAIVVALYSLDRYEEALASFDRALALSPDHTDTWTNRGNALYSLVATKRRWRALTGRWRSAGGPRGNATRLVATKRHWRALPSAGTYTRPG